MADRIGIYKWKNRSQAHFVTLQGERIMQNLDEIGYIGDQLVNGSIFVFKINGLSSPGHQELSNVRLLQDETDLDMLLSCFKDSTRENFAIAIEAIRDLAVKEQICETFPDLSPRFPWLMKKLAGVTDGESSFPQDYPEIFDAILQFQRFHFPVVWHIDSPEIRLGFMDQKLAEKWMPEESVISNEHYEYAKMLSARMAEKVAMQFYLQCYQTVKDVSIQQLRYSSQEWKQYDILAGENHPVDVKNARSPYHNRSRYIDFCVPRFKYDRNNKEIAIGGVFSPYLMVSQLVEHKDLPHDITPIYFLGETTNSKIQSYEERYTAEYLKLEVCKIRRENGRVINIIPPWVFDYSDIFYQEQNSAKENFRRAYSIGFPSEDEFFQAKINPVPALIASKLPVPQDWIRINEMHHEFIQLLYQRSEMSITLPDLYLSILADFLSHIRRLSSNSDDYSPTLYRPLLYVSESQDHPLGIRDPLNIVRDLIHDLTILWDHRKDIPWRSFISFKYEGLGLLIGETINNTSFTLLAYCGGWIDGKGKCGHSPLIFGQNKTCEKCGKLICNRCGYCSDGCYKKSEKYKYRKTRESHIKSYIPEYGCDVNGFSDEDGDSIPF